MKINICLITIDSLRADHLGCYGYHRNTSPNIDDLANNGIIYRNAFTTNTATFGSFFSIFTSKYPMMGNTKYIPINDHNCSFVEKLNENGYNTAGFNSNPHLLKNKGFNRGFDLFFDFLKSDESQSKNIKTKNIRNDVRKLIENKKTLKKGLKFITKPFLKRQLGYLEANAINEEVFRWMRNREEGNFFLWIHYMDVHMPYIPENEYLNKIGINYSISQRKMWNLKDKLYSFQTTRKIAEKDVRYLFDLYDAEIRLVDDYIGELIQEFKQNGLMNNTTIIITADHGEEFMEHNGLGHSTNLYDEVLRVPLIIYKPKNQLKNIIDTNVSHIDMASTIEDIAGISNGNFLGENVLNFTEKEDPSRFILAEDVHIYKKKKLRVVRTTTMKYIFDEWNGTHELYNIKKDPKETNNLANNEDDIPQELKKIINKQIKDEKINKRAQERAKIAKVLSEKKIIK
jgi:arylsulfatase A-like enzyme